MSKTIPIWTCVLNRAVSNFLKEMHHKDTQLKEVSPDWDCTLHLPLWVSKTERAAIEDRLEEWTEQLMASGADITSLAACLKKSLRPLWISQKTVIWLNEVPDHDSWAFTPIILVSASSSSGMGQHKAPSEFSWNYIPGAGDDEESWARGLSPNLFWNNAYDLINSGPDTCNQKVADIVEKDRVYRAYRGQNAPQIMVKTPMSLESSSSLSPEELVSSDISNTKIEVKYMDEGSAIYWLGLTNLAVGTTQIAAYVSHVDCILNCDHNKSISVNLPSAYLHLPMATSKFNRSSVLNKLPSAVNFAKMNLNQGKKILVCCDNGEDISICVCLAILTSLFDDEGNFDDGKSFSKTQTTKWEMRRRLVYICKFATNARPSRGNLKQVFNFLHGGNTVHNPHQVMTG
ncbi:initiator tRNA phosphoribosyl transferase family protein [Quillaja saponaria]|uniref:Initiator tRNA phosphoribosyl transferase family protein n=1 Tax=Quillaja saponaria TaxID=32244 RepID=A0AAD7PWN9_QUISA|nr:initiator tRNA phosphoribosyl transferase family protein [Quillaja saponaria]